MRHVLCRLRAPARYLTAILTLKHYVANSVDNTNVNRSARVDGQEYTKGQNINRHTMDVTVSNAALQEYLGAFRAAAKAGARGMMCSCVLFHSATQQLR